MGRGVGEGRGRGQPMLDTTNQQFARGLFTFFTSFPRAGSHSLKHGEAVQSWLSTKIISIYYCEVLIITRYYYLQYWCVFFVLGLFWVCFLFF